MCIRDSLRADLVLIHHTEAGLGTAGNGIDLVSGAGGMEVDLPLPVGIAHGQGIGIAAVPCQRQYAAGVPLQDRPALGQMCIRDSPGAPAQRRTDPI